jgi:hypothetical protein
MAEIARWEFEGRSDRLFIHFDVQDHFLKLDTFIKTADSARRVIEALDKTFFQGTLEYELIVIPPEGGTFLSKLALWISGGTAAVFTFVNTDVGSAFVEGLTGQSPSHWATTIGEKTRSTFQDATELIQYEDAPKDDAPPMQGEQPVSPADEAACHASAKIVVAMARGILEKSTDQLNKIGMEVGNLAEALEARADFYSACIEDREVKRIGFTSDDDFPIPRNSFPERAQKPARKEKEEKPPTWAVSIESIYVTSPNWDEDDQEARHWKGKDQLRRDCYFVIVDAEFWHLVKRKNLRVEVLDNLRVQWACQIVDGRAKNRRVLRVLEFNGDKLADALAPDAINAILGEYSTLDAPRGEPTLFDD